MSEIVSATVAFSSAAYGMSGTGHSHKMPK